MSIDSQRRIALWSVLALLLGGVWWWRQQRSASSSGPLTPEAAEKVARAYLALEAREQAVNASLWAPELDAERHEDVLLRLWDSLNAVPDPWAVLAEFSIAKVLLPGLGTQAPLPHGIQAWRLAQNQPSAVPLEPEAWRNWVLGWRSAGWRLGRTTWALTRHRPATNGSSAESVFAVTAQLENPGQDLRAMLRASAQVAWGNAGEPVPVPARLEVQDGDLLIRHGPPAFRPWLEEVIPADRSIFTDPLLVWDLEGGGFPDVILVGADRVWRNRPAPEGGRRFTSEPWLGLPVERIVAAVRADVNGDGTDDLVIANTAGVSWWPGQGTGGPVAGTPVFGWTAPVPLKHPQVIAAGDVDGDGDLDLWVVQYKQPYQGGQFPTPWYDANDGFPSYLLFNDGHGHFTDATVASGLGAKRFRRSYSASFVDLDQDGDLDLVNVSDFAGLDVYLNDGRGHFTDVTAALGDARHAFGMAHIVSDFNADGRPDLLMLGMGSTVAGRLAALGLSRETSGEGGGVLSAMTWGNRLYLGGGARGMPLTPTGEPAAKGLASTGWTWGAAWADFDNDGNLDLAVANGHETRGSVRDYERQFWSHDRFVAGSANDLAADYYFRTATGRRQAEHASYGGWQNNEFRLNVANREFPDVAWLLGVAVPADSRNLVAADLDGDGRLDLVVTTLEEWPQRRQRLLVFHNELAVGDWIGFRFAGAPPPGTRVELELPPSKPARWLITGESFRSQGPPAVHFGLGTNRPTAARVIWPDGAQIALPGVAPNQWHQIDARRGK